MTISAVERDDHQIGDCRADEPEARSLTVRVEGGPEFAVPDGDPAVLGVLDDPIRVAYKIVMDPACDERWAAAAAFWPDFNLAMGIVSKFFSSAVVINALASTWLAELNLRPGDPPDIVCAIVGRNLDLDDTYFRQLPARLVTSDNERLGVGLSREEHEVARALTEDYNGTVEDLLGAVRLICAGTQ